MTNQSETLKQGSGSGTRTLEAVEEVEREIRRVSPRTSRVEHVLSEARARAEPAHGSSGEREGGLAVCVFLAEALSGLVLEREWRRGELVRLFERAAQRVGLEREAVESAALIDAVRDPKLLSLPPRVSAEALLRLLYGCAPVAEASLWTSSVTDPLHVVARVGPGAPTRRVKAAAREVIFGGSDQVVGSRVLIHALPVLRWEQPAGALVIRAERQGVARALALARETAGSLSLVVEREMLLERSVAREHALVAAAEHRVRRIGLDLHDGALQEIARLRGDTRLFRRQLAENLPGEVARELLLGRVDDVTAGLVAIDEELRALAGSLQSLAMLNKPFRKAIEDELALFRTRTGVQVDLDANGEFERTSPAQRIAILRILQEALENAREHGGAGNARVSVRDAGGQVVVRVVDDGKGFDVERTLGLAARRGRLGLLGMRERALLLGGVLTVQSAVGGPTTVSVTLPERRPLSRDGELPGEGELRSLLGT